MQTIFGDKELRGAIINTLTYFHMFRHPLYAYEIYNFLGVSSCRDKLNDILNKMVAEKDIYFSHNMYSLENSGQIFIKRLVGADVAAEKIKDARRSAAVIACFPFVRSIAISGSLSKGYADEKSDIDFFIITSKRRLWICRSILHLFKKATFLVGKQHSFCMNYFIDESEMCLEEQNIFTATELNTIIPVYNIAVYHDLIQQNKYWMNSFLPNVVPNEGQVREVRGLAAVKRFAEGVFNNVLPEKINTFLMNLTDRLWRYKWQKKNYPMKDYDLAMKTKWYVSKHHPLNYQKRVLHFNNVV